MNRALALTLSAVAVFLLSPRLVEPRLAAQQPPGKYRPHRGPRVPDQYIVVLEDAAAGGSSATEASVEGVADELSRIHGGQRRHIYTRALKGFSVRLPEPAARRLSQDPRVAYVEEDGVTSGGAVQAGPQNWGLDRIDQRSPTLDNEYTYLADGTGVHIYVVDSGVYIGHNGFGGRASAPFDAVGDGQPAGTDCVGHGTHVAGIAASTLYGVAKNASIFSVRALGCSNTGSWADYIEALDWVIANHVKPAVVNASIGGSSVGAAEEAIARVTQAGIVFVGSAGNNNEPACLYVPGSARSAIVVGNIGPGDVRSSSSNYGECVDIFAPGEAILSTVPGSPDASAQYWGTSMASPHVAGSAALYLQRHPTATVAQVTDAIIAGATLDTVVDALSPNRVLFGLYLGDGTQPSVGLTAPLQSSTVRGTVVVSANATDDSEIASVQFLVDSAAIGTDTTSPYTVTWTTTGTTNGSHTVRAIAKDLAGNTAENSVVVTVSNPADTTVPSVSITSPVDGAAVSGVVTLAAAASDNVGVAKVEFYRDSVLLGTDSSAPYSFAWNTASIANRDYSITARAVDTSNNTKVSAPVVVWVSNGAGALPAGWSSADVGQVGAAGSASYDAGTFTVNAAGQDIYSTADAFSFAYRSWMGDGEIVARVTALTKPSGAAFALAGVAFRESLTGNARHASVLVATDGKVKFRRRTATGATTLSDGPSAGSVTVPIWLRVRRAGNVFTAWRSADGVSWTQTGPAATIDLPTTVFVGVWALRNGGSSLTTARFTQVAVGVPSTLPAGWTSDDVGAVGAPGTAIYAGGTYTVRGSGTDLWSTADAFHFVHRTWSGDGDLVARLTKLSAPAGATGAMAGIMIRNGLAPGAVHASLLVGTDGKLKFRRRTAAGSSTLSNGPSAGSTTVPRWLKLSRRGSQVSAYASTDGTNWTAVYVPQSIALPASVEVGIWTLANGSSALAEGTFSQVAVTPAATGSLTESFTAPSSQR